MTPFKFFLGWQKFYGVKEEIASCTRPKCHDFNLTDSKNSVSVELHTCQRYGDNSCRKTHILA